MDDLTELRDQFQQRRPMDWEQLPDFALYMDQVLSYMDRQVIRFDGDDGLTAAMVNNYTKRGLLPRAVGKKYHREHLAYLTVICILKRVMSTRNMDLLIRKELGERPVREGYAAFCESLGTAMDLISDEISDEMGKCSGEDNLADIAIHFALLSYAAGLASSRCVSLLRRQREEPSPKKRPKKELPHQEEHS